MLILTRNRLEWFKYGSHDRDADVACSCEAARSNVSILHTGTVVLKMHRLSQCSGQLTVYLWVYYVMLLLFSGKVVQYLRVACIGLFPPRENASIMDGKGSPSWHFILLVGEVATLG